MNGALHGLRKEKLFMVCMQGTADQWSMVCAHRWCGALQQDAFQRIFAAALILSDARLIAAFYGDLQLLQQLHGCHRVHALPGSPGLPYQQLQLCNPDVEAERL